MEKIVISSNVRKALDELVDILYYKEYFSYKKSAQDYINNLYDFILTIPSLRYKTTLNKKYGAFYCCYKHNAKTSWYFLFDIEDNTYFIKNITNNHSEKYVKFIAIIK
jgi:hypothetical protein